MAGILEGTKDKDPYTDEPTHLRIYSEGNGDWSVDGANDTGHYTESSWSYPTFQEAVAAAPAFVAAAPSNGYVFRWRSPHRQNVRA